MYALHSLRYYFYTVEKNAFALQYRELEILDMPHDVSNLKVFMEMQNGFIAPRCKRYSIVCPVLITVDIYRPDTLYSVYGIYAVSDLLKLDDTTKLLRIDVERPHYLVIYELLYVIANIYYVVIKRDFDSRLAVLVEIGICFVKIPGFYILYVWIGANRELDQYGLYYLVFCSYCLKMIELVVYRLLHLHYLFVLHRRLGLYPQIRIIGVGRIDVLEVGAVKRNVVEIVFSRVYTKPGFGPAIRMVFALYAVFVKPFIQRSDIAHIVHALDVYDPCQAKSVSIRLDVIFGILCSNKSVTSLEPARRIVPYIAYVFFFSELGSYGLRSGNLNLPVRCVVYKPGYAEFVIACFRRTEHLFAQIARNNRFHLYPVVLQLYRRKIYLYKVHFAVFAIGLKIEYIYSVPGL